MSTFAFPSVTPNAQSIELIANTDRFVSQVTGSVKTRYRAGERWLVRLMFINLKNPERAELQAFLARLNGQQHRFTLRNHSEANRGAFGGTPLVAGASQVGNTLSVDGCSNNITNWIRAGDWFGVNGELKMATLDASSDGSGNITLTFSPRLRASPADNAAITTAQATGVFMLEDVRASWSNRPGGFSDVALNAIEDFV